MVAKPIPRLAQSQSPLHPTTHQLSTEQPTSSPAPQRVGAFQFLQSLLQAGPIPHSKGGLYLGTTLDSDAINIPLESSGRGQFTKAPKVLHKGTAQGNFPSSLDVSFDVKKNAINSG